MAARRPPLLPLILALSALGLGIYLWRVDARKPSSDEAREQRARLLPGLEAEHVRALGFSGGAHAWKLARREAGDAAARRGGKVAGERKAEWDLLEPVRARGEAGQVTGLIDRLVDLDRARTVAQPESDLSQYGLDKPAGVITATLDSEAAPDLPREIKWEIGGPTPFPGERYLRDQSGAIHAVADGLLAGFDLDPAVLRDRRLFSFETTAVKTVAITRAGALFATLARGSERWSFTAPVADWAAGGAVDNFLIGLQFASADSFADETPADPAKYGLDKPAVRLELTGPDGVEWLEVGAPAAAPPAGATLSAAAALPPARRYARSSLSPAVVTVAESALTPLLVDEPIGREKRMLPEGDWIRAQFGAGAAFVRAGGEWRSETPPPSGKKLNGALIAGRLLALQSAEASGFGGVIAGREKELGFASPHRKLILTGAGKPVEVVIGAETAGGRWARVGDRPAALVLSPELVRQFPESGAEFFEPLPAAPASAAK